MSNDPSHEQVPQHQPKPDLRLDGAGLSAGERWANTETTISNLQRILYHIEEGEYPNLLQCPDSDHAIEELVRIIRPPRGSQLGSTKEYWRLITEDDPEVACTVPYVAGFFESVYDTIYAEIEYAALTAAKEWLQSTASPQELEHAAEFTERYGDTWEEGFPNGCTSVYEVALYMMGRDLSRYRGHLPEGEDEGVPADPAQDFRAMFRDGCFALNSPTLATAFVREMVDLIQHPKYAPNRPTKGESGEADSGSIRGNDARLPTPPKRRRRRYGLRVWPRIVRKPRDPEVPPNGPSSP